MQANSGRWGRLIGGGLLILLGVLQLLDTTLDVQFNEWFWIAGFVLAAVAFGWVYLRERELWAGIVAYVSGALAVVVFLATQLNVPGVILPSMVLAAIGVPFVIAWTQNRKQWGLLIPAYVMFAIIPILFMGDSGGNLVPSYVMFVIGLPFLVGYVVSRQAGLLVPAGVMLVIGAFLLFDAVATLGNIMSIIVPLGLILGGVLLLVRPGRGADATLKPKRENEG